MCDCNEGFIQRTSINADGVKIPGIRAPMVHDCAYIRRRDALIPAAERIAEQAVQHLDKVPRRRAFATSFMRTMNDLWLASEAAK